MFDTQKRLTRIEAKLDVVLEEHEKKLGVHARRIDALESTRDRQRGAAKLAAIIFTAATGIFGAVVAYFKHFGGNNP